MAADCEENGDLNFWLSHVEDKRQDLLEQRRRVLDESDPILQAETGRIMERLGERRLILTNRMEAELSWVHEKTDADLSKLDEDEELEVTNCISKLSERLDEIKADFISQVSTLDLFDRRTLHLFDMVDQRLPVHRRYSQDPGSHSPAQSTEKRSVMPGRLISDSSIKEDLLQLNQSFTTTETDVSEVAKPMRPRHRVIMDKTRLIYDGKTFYRGQKLFVQTMNYTRFPAIVYALADEYVHIRSRTPGDTREVFATIDDLRAGRVRIGRKVVTP